MGRPRTALAGVSSVTEVARVLQGDPSPAQLEWLRWDPLSKRPRVAGVHPHETLHSTLPLSWAGHHGVCAGADSRVRPLGARWEGCWGLSSHTHALSLPTGTWCRWGSRCLDTRSAFFAVFRDSRTEPSPPPTLSAGSKDGALVTPAPSLSLPGLGAAPAPLP